MASPAVGPSLSSLPSFPSSLSLPISSLSPSLLPLPPFVYYRIQGAADCPFFARAERVGALLRKQMGWGEEQLAIHMVSPKKWEQMYPSPSSSSSSSPASSSSSSSSSPSSSSRPLLHPRVRIDCPSTGRVVSDEKAFRKEILEKYGVSCDWDWGRIKCVAEENKAMQETRDKIAAEKEKEEERKSKEGKRRK